ncbi:Na+/H+ antiporter NhaC [Rathayibacter sp. CAU 1779]
MRPPSLADAIIPLVTLAVLIAGGLALFGLDALDGPIQVALILSAMVASLIALKNGHSWHRVEHAGQTALSSLTSAIFILLSVGALIGTWNLSGTIPTLVYYGIQVLAPSWYYAATALICGVIALSIGSSWTTAATIGVGLVGIAGMLGVSPAITAGAVISGAYLGDKLSPLSETSILSAQLVGVDIYRHIRKQAWTSVPAFLIAFVAFLIIGLSASASVHPPLSEEVELHSLSSVFWINPLNLLPLVFLIVLSVRKVPAQLTLMASAVFAGILGAFTQPAVMHDFAAGSAANPILGSIKGIWLAMANGFTIDTPFHEINRLLSRGGMDSMLLTILLIIGAVTFGAILEEFGLISRLLDPVIAAAKSRGALYVTVFGTAFGLNIVAGDQYIALVLPARIYRVEFEKRGLAPTNLSRLVADSGTVTSALVPWNSCGAFMSAVLGVATPVYLPFAIFNYASPILSVLYGITGFKVEKLPQPSTTSAQE